MDAPVRISLLAFVLCLAFSLSPPARHAVEAVWTAGWDLFDKRPVETVLVVGNSRVYHNDMPAMIRPIADSAGSPVRYAVTMYAKPGATFADHWKDEKIHDLLGQRWSLVVFQAESAAQATVSRDRRFHDFGARLIALARASGSAVAVNVGWAYDESSFDGSSSRRAAFVGVIGDEHRRLSAETGALLIDTRLAWEHLRAASPGLRLTTDGNHPTVDGSYLSALMVYRFLAGAPAAAVTFEPEGVTPGEGPTIRAAADSVAMPTRN